MTLCWSLDKLGPMARSVEDAMLVLNAITGPDNHDISAVPSKLAFDAAAPVTRLKVGYFPAWMKESPATEVDRAAHASISTLVMTPVEVPLPHCPSSHLNPSSSPQPAA